jgi:hypothetical protein
LFQDTPLGFMARTIPTPSESKPRQISTDEGHLAKTGSDGMEWLDSEKAKKYGIRL